jgi:N-(2-amino-2-carboxyethyl)-L-glutamate synthase
VELIEDGVLATIGNTPLVRLTRALNGNRFNLFAKLEGFNPGGSIKDRAAFKMIEAAIEEGLIKPDTVIIESSSGNLGIGLAQVCLYSGLRFLCVIDAKTTATNRRLLEAYGAELDVVTEPDQATGEFLKARLDRVAVLLRMFESAFWPNQYANLYNPLAHRRTMQEIVEALDGQVDYLFCATSTCGTLRGCAEYARDNSIGALRIFAVDAVGSVIFGGPSGKRLIPGHGAGVRPALYRDGLAYKCVHVTDWECIVGCRTLLSTEALLVGGSSGATFMALNRVKDQIREGENCVLIFPDRGERYLDTIFSDEWVSRHFDSSLNKEQKLFDSLNVDHDGKRERNCRETNALV